LSDPARQPATYEDLLALPNHVVGQLIAGELIVTPRPSRRHSKAAAALSGELIPPFDFGRGGPGGWVILLEPEVRLGEHVVVPDLAGWRRERFPVSEEHNWISEVPDWVCEILSPNTVRVDRITKMPLYGEHGVRHVWIVDPISRTLEVFGLQPSGAWLTLALHAEDETVRAEPFREAEIKLSNFWLG
jgi:Uma2 family endonuclease